MRSSSRSLGLLPLLMALAAGVPAQQPHPVGVYVEAVGSHGAAGRVGLREGDLIQRWERGSVKGEIESPFDLAEIETEQAPLGSIRLEGERDGQEQHWTLGLDEWALRSRPVLSGALQKLYDEATRRESAGAHVEAAQQWLAAAKSRDSAAPGLVPWFLRRAAQSLALAHQKKRLDEIYREALERAANSKPAISIQILQSWADACQQENDRAHAQEHYKQALAAGEKGSTETFSSALSLEGLGHLFEQRDNFALAQEYYDRALTIRAQLAPDSLAVATSFSDESLLALKRGDFAHAEDYARRALEIQEHRVPESLAAAASINTLGRIFTARGDLVNAEKYYSRALGLREKLTPGSSEVASSLNNLGTVFGQRGDLINSEEYLRRALAIEEKSAPGSLRVAYILTNLGNVNGQRGDLIKSEECLRRALAIERKLVPGGLETATVLSNLGTLFLRRGDLSRAEEYFDEALTIRTERAPGSLAEAYNLGDLGRVASQRGDLRKAEKYYRRALVVVERSAPGSLEVAEDLDYLGDVFKARDELVKATQYYRHALAIREKLAPESLHVARTLSNLGGVSFKGGDLAAAEQYYTRALAIIAKLSPASIINAEVLVALAKLNLQRQQPGTAAELFAQALNATERQTSLLGGTASERARFRSEHVSYYKDYMDVLLAQHRAAAAFEVLERSRARSFLELLAERDLVFAADLPVEIHEARQENAAASDHTQAKIARLSLQKDSIQIEQLQQHLRDLEAERETIAERARRLSPRFAALHYPRPLDLEAVRAELDPGTALLSYSVSEDHTLLFAVRPAGAEPALSVFELKVTQQTLRRLVKELRGLIQMAPSGLARLTAEERELYDLLLKPAESIISSSQRLLLIPDGPLQVLPFAALQPSPGHYLVEWKPVHTAISATVYAELKRARPAKSARPVELAAFGDPVYLSSSEVVATAYRDRSSILSRLPFSRAEVQSIAGLFAGHEVQYLGGRATEEHAKALGKDVRYIHFATHGLLDEQFPLNSALVLTIPPQPAEGRENGLLQAWEIFEQMRLDADLVTLSACGTGLGQELNGEGLIGLTRAFQYAGARSVLASLWSVDDYRTMQLMKRFYAELHAGASKDTALQTAQLQLRRSNAKDPYYWAAFSLSGDWH